MTQPVTTVKFATLVASDAINARAASKDGIDDLAASIAAKGLIQPLCVRPADGGRYEVIDGRRRHQAITKLVKAKTWKKDADIPVLVRNEDDSDALETSLIANTARLPMHPIDQHTVFARLAEQGKTPAEIAARFGIAERTVRQQQALGRLAPVVRAAWRADKIDASTAKAFTLHPDHEVQAAAYERLKKAGPYALTEHGVRRELANDRPAKDDVPAAVLERYLAAGGTVVEDLFGDKSYLNDGALARQIRDTYQAEQAAETIEELRQQGWGWVEAATDLPSDWKWSWDKIRHEVPDLSDEDEARIEKLTADYDKASEADDEAAMDRIDAAIEAIERANRLRAFTPEMRARSGAVYSFYSDGDISVAYGILRPSADGQVDLEEAIDAAGNDDVEGEDDAEKSASIADDDDGSHISGALLETITTLQTEAASAVLSIHPEIAVRIACAALATLTYASPAKLHIDHHALKMATPQGKFEDSFAGAMGVPFDLALRELARLVASSLFLVATHRNADRSGPEALVAALPADEYLTVMRGKFLPEDFFSRASKAVALAAIDEMREAGHAAGIAPEDALAAMKKADLAAAAATAARACGWLPVQLRHPAYALIASSASAGRLPGGQSAQATKKGAKR